MNDDQDVPASPGEAGRELVPTEDGPPRAPADERGEPEQADEKPIEPEEARIDEDSKEKILGSQYERQRFTRNRAKGQSMWGDGNTQNIFSSSMATVFRRPPQIDELEEYYVRTESQETALRAALKHHTTICLYGEPETGRFSTACMALLELFDPGNIEEIIPPPSQRPTEAIHDLGNEDLTPNSGYLLRIENSAPDPYISRLDALMRENRSRLVLIRNTSPKATSRGGNEVAHVPPSQARVFCKHIQRLGRTSARDVTGYLALADFLPLPRKPREVVWLARESLQRSVAEAKAFAEEQDTSKLHLKAHTILVGEEGASARRRLPQHRRAFRLAYAAMAGHPIGRVFEATGRLLTVLDTESGWADLGRTALEHPVTTLLGDDLAAQWQVADNPRRLARVDDDLARSIFDVAWHEFDHTRPALLTWLQLMVEEPRESSREAAIRVAVILALVDFEGIWESIVENWSRSAKSRVRLSAAKVALYLGSANRVQHLVARHVHGWVRGTNYQRDSAAWAYAGGLLLTDRRWILADLRQIAMDPRQKPGWTIATAVSRLLTPEAGGLIVSTLAGWIREDGPDRVVTRHAARAFTRMARMPRDGRITVPVLLGGLAEDAVPISDLSVLWYAALLGVSTRLSAWNGLLTWLSHADRDIGLRLPMERMLRDMAAVAALRRRLLSCLSRSDTPPWITAVTKDWTR